MGYSTIRKKKTGLDICIMFSVTIQCVKSYSTCSYSYVNFEKVGHFKIMIKIIASRLRIRERKIIFCCTVGL